MLSKLKQLLTGGNKECNLQSFGSTHTGLVRQSNQDAISLQQESGLFIVCDGLGGHTGGDMASNCAVQAIRKLIAQGSDIVSAVRQAHHRVAKLGEDMAAGSRRPGSTVVALHLTPTDWQVAWVGDSRCWLISKTAVKQVTVDHTIVQQMVDWGDITPGEAASHPERNKLSQSLGSSKDVVVGFERGELQSGQFFLLASDGMAFWHEPRQLQEIVLRHNPQQAVEQLISESLDAGGTDNVSCVVVAVT